MSITYPYLPQGREIKYVPGDNPFMKEAEIACKTLSTEKNHSTGAVVVMNGKIIGKAANQAGFKHPKLIEMHKKGMCVRKLFKVKSGEKYWLCPGCASSNNHAEALAVNDAKKNIGAKPEGADLYLWGHWWCCEPCWNEMVDKGIKNVYLLEGSEKYFDRNNPEHIIGK